MDFTTNVNMYFSDLLQILTAGKNIFAPHDTAGFEHNLLGQKIHKIILFKSPLTYI